MALKLSLKPGETFILNGAVLRNGDRRGVLLLENRARILREKDIMMPEEATTPAGRAYFAVMQMYLIGENSGPLYDRAVRALIDLAMSDTGADTRERIEQISADIVDGTLYQALGGCRKLLRKVEPHHFEGPNYGRA